MAKKVTIERKKIIAGILLLLLLVAAVAGALWNRREPAQSSAARIDLAKVKPEDNTPPDVTDDPLPPPPPATAAETTPTTTSTGSSASSSNQDDDDDGGGGGTSKPKPPGETPAEKAWREYLAETKKIVQDNDGPLSSLSQEAITALAMGDPLSLADLYAIDENAGSTDAQAKIASYPLILSTQPASTVNIFTVNQATIYFTYVVAKWEDAGIVSEHTIAIPMRFINGQWRVSTIDEKTPGLTFVQSVQM